MLLTSRQNSVTLKLPVHFLLSDHLIPNSIKLCMQAHDYADDPLLETYLQLLAVDRSKVILYGLFPLLCRLKEVMTTA